MTVTLRISNDAARANGADPQKVFDEQGGTIGRAPGNDWVLPDPERVLSSHHAAIYFKEGAWYLADTSANGVFVNRASQPVGSDAPARLNDGDSLQLGDYEIEVRLAAPASAAPQANSGDWATPAARAQFQPAASIPETLDPLELLTGGAATKPAIESPAPPQAPLADNGVADLSGPIEMDPMGSPSAPFLKDMPASATAGSHPDDVGVLESGFRPPAASSEPISEQIPEDWDPLATPALSPGPAQPTPIGAPRAPLAPDSAPPLAPTTHSNPPPAGPIEMPGATPAAPAAATPPATAATSDAMLRAFFEGTGLDPSECLAKADPQLPRLVGQIFHEVVAGMHAVLVARAHLKSGFRMNLTMIKQRENNPLKFSAGGTDEAMQHLLFHSGSSYQSPLEAFREGFDDLKNHQVAVMSGMQAALLSVLQRFDPEKLAADFEQRASTGWGLGNKRAKYWELYAQFYRELLSEVEDDFHDTVGRIFAKSYEEQLERLASAGKNNDARK